MNKVTLYGLNKNAGLKIWSIWTESEILYIEHGKLGGKLQLKSEAVVGKNIGKSNETTGTQQAELEAKSRINKQIDKGYRENPDDLKELDILPMLAADYLKQGHRIEYPCYVSAKLDGVRCLAIRHEDSVELKSRGGKEYSVPHIQQALMDVMKVGDIWDGELYIHGKFLEEIVSAVKKQNENSKNIKFIIFDVVNDQPYSERLKCAQDMQIKPNVSLEFLYPQVVFNEDEMKSVHKKYVACGYEGIMLRNSSGVYESGKRSADLQKYKTFMDAEFQIVDVITDKDGGAIFVVQNLFAPNQFNVVGGSHDQRKVWLQEKESLIGKWITVKYQTLYKDTKIPQFPTLVSFREADSQGNPLE